jgi:uncharacterized membrane protein YhaH (DUF805 family)
MNATINEKSSAGLSLQPDLQPQVIICPKCQHKRTADDEGPDWRCPSCGIAYSKAAAPSAAVTHIVTSTSRARGRQESNYDELESATPRAIALSLTGRIGRLRYLAFSSLIMFLSVSSGVVAAIINPLHKEPSRLLIVLAVGVFGVLWLWMPLRLMVLRLHDVNQSGKWLLALLLLPGLAAVLGGGPQVVAMSAGIFWIVALVLGVVPGSEDDNDYGPPPGPNTTWVTVGACLYLVFMVLGVVGNIKYGNMMRAAKLHSPVPASVAH